MFRKQSASMVRCHIGLWIGFVKVNLKIWGKATSWITWTFYTWIITYVSVELV
jgi:hypothetical protein